MSEAESTWTVTIVRYGTRTATREDVFLNYGVYHQPDSAIRMDYFFWVLQNGERQILVDTGFSVAGGAARKRTFVLQPGEAFIRAGVDPTITTEVLLTHAHFDHIGNIGRFPAATFTIAQEEIDFWTGPNAHQVLFHHSIEDSEIEGLLAAAAQGRVRTFQRSIDVAPGITMRTVGGHTPGQSVVLVDTAEGRVVLTSDAVHYYEELERDMPFVSVADVVGMYDAFRYIRSLVDVGEVRHVVSGHDPSTLSRFTPAVGDLAGFGATIGFAEERA